MMTGEQLLQALLALTPEQRQFPVVVEEGDGYCYDTLKLETICCEDGHEEDEPHNSIVIRTTS